MDVQSKTTVSENVFQSMVEFALRDVEDIVSKEKKGPLAGITRIFAERFSPQVTVRKEENDAGLGQVGFELKLAVIYGVNIPETATKIRKKIIETIESLTGYKVIQVDIIVDRIVEVKELQNESVEEMAIMPTPS